MSLISKTPTSEDTNRSLPERTIFSDIWPLVAKLYRGERRDIIVVLIYGVLASILEFVVPLSSQAIVSVVALGVHTEQLVVLCLIVLLAMLAMALVLIFQRHVIDYIQRRQFMVTAREMVLRIPRVQEAMYESYYAPELVNRFFDIVTIQKAVSKFLLDGVSALLSLLVGLVVLGIYHPLFLMYDIVFLLFLPVLIFGLGRKAIATAVDESSMKYKTLEWIEEVARSHRSIKLRNAYKYVTQQVEDLAYSYAEAKERHFRIYARQILGSYIFKAFAIVGILALGGNLVIDQQISIGQLVAAEIIIVLMTNAMDKLLTQFNVYYEFAAALSKVETINDLPLDPTGRANIDVNHGPFAVELSSVVSPYSTANTKNSTISLKFERGSKIALIGSNHFELSHIGKIIAGVNTPNSGFVELFGQNITAIDISSLHKNVSYVDMDDVVQQSTVYDNITMGDEIADTSLHEVLNIACMEDAIRTLPIGVYTPTEIRGRNLVHSMRKRIVLARALYGRPKVLIINGIIDELDYKLQRSLMQSLMSLSDTTIVFITGDPVVIRECQRAVVIDQGCITNDGRVQDLVTTDPFLQQLLTN